MSSHDMAVSGLVKVRGDVTLSQVLDKFKPFLMWWEVEAVDNGATTVPGDVGVIDFGEFNDSYIELAEADDDGRPYRSLRIWLSCRGLGHGTLPSGMDEQQKDGALAWLASVMVEPAWLEVFDHDISASNTEEARVPIFLGSSETQRKLSQVEYAISLAAAWLEPVIGKTGFDAVAKAARDSVPVPAVAEELETA